MSFFDLTYAYTSNDPWQKEIVKSRLDDLCDYLNAHISGHKFVFHNFGEVPYRHSTYDDSKKFLDDVLNYVDENFLTYGLYPYENVCVAVEYLGAGYGYSRGVTDINGNPAIGCYANANGGLSQAETKIFSWHEPIHGWTSGGGKEDHGRAYRYINTSSGQTLSEYTIEEITPMGAAYNIDHDGDADTPWRSQHTDQEPDEFDCTGLCLHTDNYNYENIHGSHDLARLSQSTIDAVQSWADSISSD